MPIQSEKSEFNRNLRDVALMCGCAEGTVCPIHAVQVVPGGMRNVIENAVYQTIAGWVTAWVKPSQIRLWVDCTPIDPTSRENVYRRLCRLKSDMDADTLTVHNQWIRAGKPIMYPNHAESACKWCTAPKEALTDFLG